MTPVVSCKSVKSPHLEAGGSSQDSSTQTEGEGFSGCESLEYFLPFSVKEFNIIQCLKDTSLLFSWILLINVWVTGRNNKPGNDSEELLPHSQKRGRMQVEHYRILHVHVIRL